MWNEPSAERTERITVEIGLIRACFQTLVIQYFESTSDYLFVLRRLMALELQVEESYLETRI